MRKDTQEQLEECYRHIEPYIGRKETPELFAMCDHCENFCGDDHDFGECIDQQCFKSWLAFEYLEWCNSFGGSE